MKDCKLIVSDLDATLLHNDMSLSPENERAIEEFNKRGILFVPSSGRTLYEIPESIRENPNIKYITYSNGTAVYDKETKKKIISHEISKEDLNKAIDIISEYDVLWTVHIDGKSYFDKSKATDEIFDYYRANDYYRNIVLAGNGVDDLEAFTRNSDSCEGFFIFFHNDDEKEVEKRLNEEVGKITVTSSVEHEFELCSSEAGKGSTLAEFSEMLGISGDNIIAMGDSKNDVTMFPYAALALCVSNGSEEARALADEIACSNEENLADYVLKKYIEPSEAFEESPKKRSPKAVILAVAAAAVALSLIIAVIIFGTASAKKVGFIESHTSSSWSATYKKLDGELSRNITVKDGELNLSIKTESGSISIEILDDEDNTIFEKENVSNGTFEISADGKVRVIIEAEDHRGSFVIG